MSLRGWHRLDASRIGSWRRGAFDLSAVGGPNVALEWDAGSKHRDARSNDAERSAWAVPRRAAV
ncbi:MAG: hypothetical protein RMK74_06150 [Myxococcales bacterium]|nr:hypothetical protein [Myxococcales bacterium]